MNELNNVSFQWTVAEKAELRRQFKEFGGDLSKINIPGRKTDGIEKQLQQLGLVEKKPIKPWTSKGLKELRELHEIGYSAQAIFKCGVFPGRTLQAIISRMSDQRLVDKDHSEAIQKGKKRMNDIAKAEIDSFVNENHGKMTARGMARQLQIGEGVVRKAMKRLGLTFTRADVHNMPANRRAAKKRIAASREKLNEGRRKSLKDKAAKKKGELQQLKAKMTGYELKTCKVCHVQWPLADQFFPERKRVRVGKDGLAVDTTYFENTCRICKRKVR